MDMANGWIVVCPRGCEEDVDAQGDCVLYVEYTERKQRKGGAVNSPARPNDGTVRGTVASGWFEDADDMGSFGGQPWYQHRTRIGRVIVLDPWQPDDGRYLFDGLSNCREFNLLQMDTSRCSSFAGMFRGCSSVTQLLDLDRLDTSGVTDVSAMFMNCLALRAVSVAGWDTSKISKVGYMLSGCSSYVLASDDQKRFLDEVASGTAETGIWRRA